MRLVFKFSPLGCSSQDADRASGFIANTYELEAGPGRELRLALAVTLRANLPASEDSDSVGTAAGATQSSERAQLCVTTQPERCQWCAGGIRIRMSSESTVTIPGPFKFDHSRPGLKPGPGPAS
eukprot:1518225-Rhodomonas_salina.2